MGKAVDIKAVAIINSMGNKILIMYNLAINLTGLNKMTLIGYSPYSIINKGIYKQIAVWWLFRPYSTGRSPVMP